MAHTLKTNESKALSKEETIKIIRAYCEEQKLSCLKGNISDDDFDSPSWALKQAHNTGFVKMCTKLLNFIPKD